MVKLVATKLSTYLPMTEPTIALEVALHLAGILLMTKTNEKNDVFTIITQHFIIILVIIIIAYHKLVYKPKSYAARARDQNLIWKSVISSYDFRTSLILRTSLWTFTLYLLWP